MHNQQINPSVQEIQRIGLQGLSLNAGFDMKLTDISGQAPSLLADRMRNLPPLLHLKCPSNNPISEFCYTKGCKKRHSFYCSIAKCPSCFNLHKSCYTSNINYPLTKINNKMKQAIDLKTAVENIFTNIINKISELEHQIKLEIQSVFKYTHLSQIQRRFIDVFIGDTEQLYFNGDKLHNLWQIVGKDNQKKKDQNNQGLFDNIPRLNQYYQEIIQFQEKCVQDITNVRQKLKLMASEEEKLEKQRKRKSRLSVEYIETNIIKNQDELQTIIKFFEPTRAVKSLKGMYIASQNKFEMERFFDRCGKENNVIILAQSPDGQKVFGGFSSLPLQYTGEFKKGIFKFEQVPDSRQQSFTFSVTHNQTYKLLSSSKFSIMRYLDKSKLQLGAQQLQIGNNCFKQANCQTWNILNNKSCYDYSEVEFYKKNDDMVKKRQRLNGSKDDKTSLKEWECWRVEFQG